MPELIPYAEWDLESTESDPLQKLQSYTDYVRGQHWDAGTLDMQTERDIATGFAHVAQQEGLLDMELPDEERLASLEEMMAPQDDSRKNLGFLLDHYTYTEKDEDRADAIRALMAAQKVGATEERMQALQDSVNPFLTKENIRQARMSAADRGEVPFIALTEEDGSRTIYPGSEIPQGELGLMREQLIRSGAITGRDLTQLSLSMRAGPGRTAPQYKDMRMDLYSGTFDQILKEDEELGSMFQKFVKGETDAHNFENKSGLGRFGSRLLRLGAGVGQAGFEAARGAGAYAAAGIDTLLGGDAEENMRVAAASTSAPDSDALRYLGGNRDKFIDMLEQTSLGRKFSRDEIATFTDDLVRLHKSPNLDADNPERNFTTLSNGMMLANDALLSNPALHDASVEELDISQDQKDYLKMVRRNRLDAKSTEMRKNVVRLMGDDALDAWQDTKATGGTDSDFIENYLTDPDNYSGFWNRVKSFGVTSLDFGMDTLGGITSLVGHAAWITGADKAGESFITAGVELATALDNEKSKGRERASLFGDEFGFGQDVLETLPQVALDLLLTKGISKGLTAGVRTPIAATGKWSARQFGKLGFMSNASAKTKALLGESVTSSAVKATSVLKSFADDLLAESFPIGITAFMRSQGATYTSIYNQLPEDMSHEEKHSKALSYSLGSGINTAAITLAFGKMGAGGVERLVMRGFSYKQMKTLYDDILNAGRVSTNKAFSDAVTRSYKSALRHLTGKGLKHPLGEAMEEGLDEFVNTFIEAAALNKNVPLKELSDNTWNAAAIGAVLGMGGMLKERGFTSSVKGTPRAERLRQRQKIMSDIAGRLTRSGSPQTAATVNRMVDEANGRLRTVRETDEAASRADRVTAEPDRLLFNEDGQAEFDFADPRRTPAVQFNEDGQAEFDFADPRRSPNDPAQLEWDFDQPPPGVGPDGQLALPGFDPLDALVEQTEFEFKSDTDRARENVLHDPTQPPTPGPMDPTQAELTLVEGEILTGDDLMETLRAMHGLPPVPHYDEDGQAHISFNGEFSPLPKPRRPETIRDMVGRRAHYGGYHGVVTIDTDTGEAVLVLDHPTPEGITEVLLGSPNNPASGLSTRTRIAALQKDTGDFKAGTPFIRFGPNRYALPPDPVVEVLTDENGDPTGIVIRDAPRIEGGRADVIIRDSDKAMEVLRYYKSSFNGLPRVQEASPADIQAELDFHPDADPMTQVESRISDEDKAALEEVMTYLDTDLEVGGVTYNLLEVLQEFNMTRSMSAHRQFLDQLVEIPMEVFDALGSALEAAFYSLEQANIPSSSRRALAETLIDQHSQYEFIERNYLAELERRALASARGAAAPVSAPTTPFAEPESATPTPDVPDDVSPQLAQGSPEPTPSVLLDYRVEEAPATTPVKGVENEQTTLLELEALHDAAVANANDPKLNTGEKRAADATVARTRDAITDARRRVQAELEKLELAKRVLAQNTEAPTEVELRDELEEEAQRAAKIIEEADPDAQVEPMAASPRMPAAGMYVMVEALWSDIQVIVRDVDPVTRVVTVVAPDETLEEIPIEAITFPKQTGFEGLLAEAKPESEKTPTKVKPPLPPVEFEPVSEWMVQRSKPLTAREILEELLKAVIREAPEQTEEQSEAKNALITKLTSDEILQNTAKSRKRGVKVGILKRKKVSPEQIYREVETLVDNLRSPSISRQYDYLVRRLRVPREKSRVTVAEAQAEKALLEHPDIHKLLEEVGRIKPLEASVKEWAQREATTDESALLNVKAGGEYDEYEQFMEIAPDFLVSAMFDETSKNGPDAYGEKMGWGDGNTFEELQKIVMNWREIQGIDSDAGDYEAQLEKEYKLTQDFYDYVSERKPDDTRWIPVGELREGDKVQVDKTWLTVTRVTRDEDGYVDKVQLEDLFEDNAWDDRFPGQRWGIQELTGQETIYVADTKPVAITPEEAEAFEDRPVFDDEGNVIGVEDRAQLGEAFPPVMIDTHEVQLTESQSKELAGIFPKDERFKGSKQVVELEGYELHQMADALEQAAAGAKHKSRAKSLRDKAKTIRELAPERKQAELFAEQAVEETPAPRKSFADKVVEAAPEARKRLMDESRKCDL